MGESQEDHSLIVMPGFESGMMRFLRCIITRNIIFLNTFQIPKIIQLYISQPSTKQEVTVDDSSKQKSFRVEYILLDYYIAKIVQFELSYRGAGGSSRGSLISLMGGSHEGHSLVFMSGFEGGVGAIGALGALIGGRCQ